MKFSKKPKKVKGKMNHGQIFIQLFSGLVLVPFFLYYFEHYPAPPPPKYDSDWDDDL